MSIFSHPPNVFAALYLPKYQYLLQIFRPRALRSKPQAIEMTTLRQAVQQPQELVQIVDKHNKCLGSASRAEMRERNLIHRCSFTMVFNGEVCSRSLLRMAAADFGAEWL